MKLPLFCLCLAVIIQYFGRISAKFVIEAGNGLNSKTLKPMRLQCGLDTISYSDCLKRGCKYLPCIGRGCSAVPWCFRDDEYLAACPAELSNRRACDSFTAEQCDKMNCCWRPTSVYDVPWCFEKRMAPEIPTTSQPTSTRAPVPKCPPNWTLRFGKCYQYRTTPLDWPASLKDCRAANSSLIKLTSDSETNFMINELFQYDRSRFVWIGLNDKTMEGRYVWNDETQRTRYSNWRLREPNNDWGKEDCVAAWSEAGSRNNGKWNDINCFTSFLHHVCEKPATVF